MTIDYAAVCPGDPNIREIPPEYPRLSTFYFNDGAMFPRELILALVTGESFSVDQAIALVNLFGFMPGYGLSLDPSERHTDIIKVTAPRPGENVLPIEITLGVYSAVEPVLMWTVEVFHNLLTIINQLRATGVRVHRRFPIFIQAIAEAVSLIPTDVGFPRVHRAILTSAIYWIDLFFDPGILGRLRLGGNPFYHEGTGGLSLLQNILQGEYCAAWSNIPCKAAEHFSCASHIPFPMERVTPQHASLITVKSLETHCAAVFQQVEINLVRGVAPIQLSYETCKTTLAKAICPFVAKSPPEITESYLFINYQEFADTFLFSSFVDMLYTFSSIIGVELAPIFVLFADRFRINLSSFVNTYDKTTTLNICNLLSTKLFSLFVWASDYLCIHPNGLLFPKVDVFDNYFHDLTAYLVQIPTPFNEQRNVYTPASFLSVLTLFYDSMSIIEWLRFRLPRFVSNLEISLVNQHIDLSLITTSNYPPFIQQFGQSIIGQPLLLYLTSRAITGLIVDFNHPPPFTLSGRQIHTSPAIRCSTGEPLYYDNLGNSFCALPPSIALGLLGVVSENNTPYNHNLLFNWFVKCLRGSDVEVSAEIVEHLKVDFWYMSLQMGLALLPTLRLESRGLTYSAMLADPTYYIRQMEEIQETYALQQATQRNGGTPTGEDDAAAEES
jgi:hypothetical protein